MAGNYPDLIAPLIPDAQKNKSPELLIEGFTKGMAAFAQFAQMRRQSEMEVLKLAAQERIAKDQHAIEREKIYKDSQYQDSLLKSHAKYYDAMGQAATTRAAAYARGVKGMANQGEAKSEFKQGFEDRVNELGLRDPNLEKDDPAQFGINAGILGQEYGTSTLPEIRQSIRAFKIQSEQHRLQLPQVAYDAAGNPIKAGNVAPQVPVASIVRGLADPATRKTYLDRLRAGGYVVPSHEQDTGKKIKDHWWQKEWNQTETVPEKIDPGVENLINKADTADFGPRGAVQQSDFSKKQRDFRAIPQPTEAPVPEDATQPDASASPASSATPETDAILQAATIAIQKGAPMSAVLKRLADYGIDPSQMT